MAVELKVPSVGESVTEVEIGKWLKSEGESVNQDEDLVLLETDKASLELPAPSTGVITQILKNQGDSAEVGEVIGYIDEAAAAKPAAKSEPQAQAEAAPAAPAAAPKTAAKAPPSAPAAKPAAAAPAAAKGELRVMPAAQRVMAEHDISPNQVEATGPGGRILKEDVLRAVDAQKSKAAPAADVEQAPAAQGPAAPVRLEEPVPMSSLRKRIANRLVDAQQTAAMLTTFNEIDMSEVMALRKQHQDAFTARYGIKVGFMSFFVKASILALREFPQINAEIRDDSIVYKNFYDIGIAVGSGKGLVVPVLRSAESLGFADIEKQIADFGKRAQDNKLKLEELQGGTFTISNGGVYGSLLSTPILNPPQSGILGLHAIQDRPVAINKQVEVRPMMYVALTYDHRIVDGREAVTFLRRLKEAVENPARMLLEV